MVLCGGQVSGIVDARNTTKEEIGLMMVNAGDVAEVKPLERHRSKTAVRDVKEPLVRIVKRDDISRRNALLIRVFAIVLALAAGEFLYSFWGITLFPYTPT
jgi:hypothetical protein